MFKPPGAINGPPPRRPSSTVRTLPVCPRHYVSWTLAQTFSHASVRTAGKVTDAKTISTNAQRLRAQTMARGTCIDQVQAFACDCLIGFTGTRCYVNVEECASVPCREGACTDGVDAYSCDCQGTGFGGENCDVDVDVLMNGRTVLATTVATVSTYRLHLCALVAQGLEAPPVMTTWISVPMKPTIATLFLPRVPFHVRASPPVHATQDMRRPMELRSAQDA
jgi:hypothetical protein